MDAATTYLFAVTLLMGVAFASLVALLAYRRAGAPAAVIMGFGWYLLAFAPFAWRFAAPSRDSFMLNFGLTERPVDFAGAVPFCIALAAGAIAVRLLIPQRIAVSTASTTLSPLLLLVMCAVWVGWMVASEQDITEYSGIAALNSLASVAAAVAAALLITAVRRRRVSTKAAQFGVIAGLAAATASCAYIHIAAAAVVGAIAGAAATVVAQRRSATGSLSEAVVAPITIGATVGLLALGLLDQMRGFFYTGQFDLTLSQFAVICLSGAFAFATSTLVALIVRAMTRRTTPSIG